MRPSILIALPLLVAGCAATPTEFVPAAPRVASSGLVIGTVSYQYVEMDEPSRGVVARFERLDAPDTQDYALPVAVDRETHSGIFDGTLPAGVYAFREVAAAGQRYPAGAMALPFEVTAGAVRDAGHYSLNPLRQR